MVSLILFFARRIIKETSLAVADTQSRIEFHDGIPTGGLSFFCMRSEVEKGLKGLRLALGVRRETAWRLEPGAWSASHGADGCGPLTVNRA